MTRMVLMMLALLGASGCATPNVHRAIDHHLLLLDEEGQILDRHGDREPAPEARVNTMLDAMMQWLAARPEDQRRVVIHIHGGMTSTGATIERASRLIAQIRDADGPDAAWPLFISWPSGAAGSLCEGIWSLRNGRHERFFGPITAPIYLATDLVRGAARAPIDAGYMLKNDFEAASLVAFDQPLSKEWSNPVEIVRALECDPKRRDHVSIGEFRRGFLPNAGRTLSWCLTLLPKLLLTPLVLDGLGNTAWRTMRHRAYNSGRPSDEFEEGADGATSVALEERLDVTPTGGLALLMGEMLKRVRTARDEKASTADPKVMALRTSALARDFELTLIGHSMGAILINYLIELQPDLPVDDLVYMAPACSVADAARALVPFLKRKQRDRSMGAGQYAVEGSQSREPTNFWLLTLHPLAEASETYPEFLDLAARGSLLEWIDDWYTSASHPLDRVFGKWNNAIPAIHLFEPVMDQVHLKAFGVDGDSLPQRHGDFNDCPFWNRDFWHPERMPSVPAPD
jgi:pimeloyl-ACP methyl ester carboxylesterase